jgi:hypothetical protein
VKRPPVHALRITQTGSDGVERVAFIGYVAGVRYDPVTKVTTLDAKAPESLILDRDVPFAPPLSEHVQETRVFEFWWKQLDYVFGLPDPRSFPALPDVISDDDRRTVARYVTTAAELAGSGLLNALEEGFNVSMPDGPAGAQEVTTRFSRADLQVGLAALLRRCDSPQEPANFDRVRNILAAANDASSDSDMPRRTEHLRAWVGARRRLRLKSLNQLVREKLVKEGLRAFEYDEEHSPQYLLSLYSYGDLLHWDAAKGETLARFETDPFVDGDRRLAYLEAASALAHLYIGFGELARAAVGRLLTNGSWSA